MSAKKAQGKRRGTSAAENLRKIVSRTLDRNIKTKRRRKKASSYDASKLKYALVGFYDLLGFSDRIERIDSESALQRAVQAVEEVRNNFEYAPREQDQIDTHKILDKEVLAFSDCVITATSLHTELAQETGNLDLLLSELLDIARGQCASVLKGHFIRGALDIGFWYYKRGILISPTLVTVYKLEHDHTIYPIISISNRLYRHLRGSADRSRYHKSADPFPNKFSSFMHPKTQKRVHFLNYLRIMIGELDWQFDRSTHEAYMKAEPSKKGAIMSDGYKKSLSRFFLWHKEAIERALKLTHAPSVQEKYIFLAEYHNRELKRLSVYEPALAVTIQ